MDSIVCPKCKAKLDRTQECLRCSGCHEQYPIIGDVPLLFSDVSKETLKQKSIYDSSYSQAQQIASENVNYYNSKSLTIGKYLYFIKKYINGCVDNDIKILEVGIGGGHMLGTINRMYGLSPYGIDISVESVKAVSKSQLVDSNRIAVCDASSICFPDDYFDIVYTFGTLEHLDSPGKCILEINRVLKNDGIMITFCPVSDFKYSLHWLGSIFHSKAQAQANISAGHNYDSILTKSELTCEIKKTGFEVIEILCWDVFFQPIFDYKIITAGKKFRNIISGSKYEPGSNVVTQIINPPSYFTVILKKIFYPFAKILEIFDWPMSKLGVGASLFTVSRKIR